MPRKKAGEQQKVLDLSAHRRSDARIYESFVPGPNPKLSEFIRQHATPYDPATDCYDVPAFDRDLIVDKAAPPKAIYDMHTYWSKKHWTAIREYIHHYLPEKYYPRGTGIVLDCFSGSGMTGVAAIMEKRPCILIDASPAAAFISHCYTHPIDPNILEAAYGRMLTESYPVALKAKLKEVTGEEINNLQEELDWLYATKCDRCGGVATTEYVVYSERFQCPNCVEIVALSDCPKEKVPYPVGGRNMGRTVLKNKIVCPHCLVRSNDRPHRDFVISTRSQKFGPVPVKVSYLCDGDCKPMRDWRSDSEINESKWRFFSNYDVGKIEQIESKPIPHWYPDRKMMNVEDRSSPWGVKWRAGTSNFRTVAEIYTKRNLWALAAFRSAIERLREKNLCYEPLLLALQSIVLISSRMCDATSTQIKKGTYYLPQVSKALNAGFSMQSKTAMSCNAYSALESNRADVVVSCERFSWNINTDTLDYCFIDPPYAGTIQYGELNFVWESWLGFDSAWLKDEIVVNPFRNKTIDDWDRDMRAVLSRLYQALKPSRWLSLCYHDTDPGTWARVQDMLLDTGFEIHTVTVLDPLQKSSNQLTAEKVAKGDLVVNCRKPRPGEGERAERDEAGLVSQRVRDILVEVLGQTGGQTRDHLWDLVLKRLLTRGQLAAHRFDDLLSEVAFKSESGRWFLKEEFETLSENDVKNEEQAGTGLTRFARLRMSGVPAAIAAEIVLNAPRLAGEDFNEDAVENYIRQNLLKSRADAEKFKLAGRMKGVEFYDCLFFYLTRWLKGRAAGKTPRRNLAEFLDEYLVRFRDGDKWLYRVPDEAEAASLRKARQTGLGRRIRQYVAFLHGEGDYPAERRPDVRTLLVWLKHCAGFGMPEEGVALFEKGGLAAQLTQLQEDLRYDAEDYYAQCRRRAGRAAASAEDDSEEPVAGEDE